MSEGRTPPQDLDAERAVLGAVLLSRDAIADASRVLTGTEWYLPAHSMIWAVVVEMYGRGDPVDPITVSAALDRSGDLTRAGGRDYLHQLVDGCTPATAEWYAAQVRDQALLRGVIEAGTRAVAAGYDAIGDPIEMVERAVEDMRAVRDQGAAARQAPPLDLLEFLGQADDEPDWVIPGVLARWDRLMLTAAEGGGKSLLLRQVLMRAAAGLHPWKKARLSPVKCLLVDAENSASQARPWLRRMAAAAADEGAPIGAGQVVVEIPERPIDLTAPADRAWLARLVERVQPDLIAIGPLYKLTMSGNPNDEEVARSLMSALEMVRAASGGAAMMIEAHSPHATPGVRRRDLRPIGSSLWLRWPEFGFGLSPVEELGAAELRWMDWVSWRGARSERLWPDQVCMGSTWPWQAVVTSPKEEPASAEVPSVAGR